MPKAGILGQTNRWTVLVALETVALTSLCESVTNETVCISFDTDLDGAVCLIMGLSLNEASNIL